MKGGMKYLIGAVFKKETINLRKKHLGQSVADSVTRAFNDFSWELTMVYHK